uniref:Pentacotripeptide-repeat region of PRORP domain-containing protein n=1 Tax=Homalodisca liturata TaxID=320908 RepID=A0A1B6JLF5_9HEMI
MNISSFSYNCLGRQLLSYQRVIPVSILGSRFLYTPAALGLEGYIQVRERVKMQFSELGDRFRAKMKDFVSPDSVNMVFTEDLKHMVHLADATEDDLELIEEMMLKFNSQNKDLRFGSFIFGPVVMRMYYHLNRPKEALKVFLNPDLEHFFDQIISYQVLMDLLFKNEMYDEVMQVADVVKDKQIPNSRFPRNVVVLALAAAYKKNTPESLQYMKKLWAELQEAGHEPMRRAITFAAALAINQNAPHIALELLSAVPKQNYVTIRNLRVSALADVGRPDDALPILRSVLEMDGPQETKHTFCSEVIEKMKAAVSRCDKKEVHQEFQRVVDQLNQLGHVTDSSLDAQLCTEIDKVILTQARPRDQRVLAAKFNSGRGREGDYPRPLNQRAGLRDME